jgi:hypothetical protein
VTPTSSAAPVCVRWAPAMFVAIPPTVADEVRRLIAKGYTTARIAKLTGVSRLTVDRCRVASRERRRPPLFDPRHEHGPRAGPDRSADGRPVAGKARDDRGGKAGKDIPLRGSNAPPHLQKPQNPRKAGPPSAPPRCLTASGAGLF